MEIQLIIIETVLIEFILGFVFIFVIQTCLNIINLLEKLGLFCLNVLKYAQVLSFWQCVKNLIYFCLILLINKLHVLVIRIYFERKVTT